MLLRRQAFFGLVLLISALEKLQFKQPLPFSLLRYGNICR
jgi:hypothetical protein